MHIINEVIDLGNFIQHYQVVIAVVKEAVALLLIVYG